MEGKLVGKGAEAELRKTVWNGRQAALRKTRVAKKYRVAALDYSLRKRRTRREAKCLRIARENSVSVPELFLENEEKFELVIGKLEGVLLSRKKVSRKEAEQAGEVLAKLHCAGIVHGDYSTSNLMSVKSSKGGNKIFAIDFGLAELSKNLEERADDAIVFEKSLDDASLSQCFRKGYARKAGASEAQAVFSRTKQILSRARYARTII